MLFRALAAALIAFLAIASVHANESWPILRADPDGQNLEVVVPADQTKAFVDIAVDPDPGGRLYWPTTENCTDYHCSFRLRSSTLEGAGVEITADGYRPIVIDSEADTIFAPAGQDDTGSSVLFRFDLDGQNRESFGFVSQFFDAAYDPVDDRYYWTSDSGWESMNRDGSDRVLLAPFEYTEGMDIDPVARKLYWITKGELWRSDLDRTGAELLVPSGVYRVVVLDPPNNRLWWTLPTEIYQADLDGGNPTVVLSGLENVRGLDYAPQLDKLYLLANPETEPKDVPATSDIGAVTLAAVVAGLAILGLMRRTRRPASPTDRT